MEATLGNGQVGNRSYPHTLADAQDSVIWGLERVRRIGFDAIEYNVEGWNAFLRGSDHILEDVPISVWREVAARAREVGLRRNSIHGLTLGSGSDLNDHEAILKRQRHFIDVAHALDAGVMVLHLSAEASAFYNTPALLPAKERDVKLVKAVGNYAADKGILVGVENGNIRYVHIVVEEVALDNVGFTMDTGHYNMASLTPDFVKGIRYLGEKLFHVHLNSNDGLLDLHYPVGDEGTVPWDDVFRTLHEIDYQGVFMQESVIFPYGVGEHTDEEVEQKWRITLSNSKKYVERYWGDNAVDF